MMITKRGKRVSEQKRALRRVLLKARKELSPEAYQKGSQQICNQLWEGILQTKCGAIHLFLPHLKQKEVNLYPLIERLLRAGHPVISSKMALEGGLTHHAIGRETLLTRNHLGILEPSDTPPLTNAILSTIDVVIIPLLGVDRFGHRLGYGGGFYDRFLPQIPKATRIGLSLLPILEEPLPSEPHDIPLHRVITPDEVHCLI